MNAAEHKVKALSRRVALAQTQAWYANNTRPDDHALASLIEATIRSLREQLEVAKAELPKKAV